jgi:hypothetical protein
VEEDRRGNLFHVEPARGGRFAADFRQPQSLARVRNATPIFALFHVEQQLTD